ncbi:NAD(P)H-binding protein [Nocardia gamkensis]|uniref:NAD(P)H-binding protein n=1 Tax=Nocardia gamkensis TaxID=352869 RepID=A0A7X6R5R5_9NOCA|nr:NAD(P)H-binding protein [Nocardia gamkensis]NKY29814.1 NAD(P)H-binding protein [Nocardia gamkensis]NQE70315.1 NADH:ubiquinone reductase (H(+)-translocating) [Nocardia gamkensis]
MILVTGATGNVGSEVVAAVRRSGQPVRALVRDIDGVALPPGVTAVSGDLDVPDTMAEAIDGARAMFLLPGHANLPALLDRAKSAGLQHVVLLSSGSAELVDSANVVARSMARSEQAVRESGLAWTFLRPRSFMSNALRWLPQLAAGDVVRVRFPRVPVAAIDPADIAAVAARALTDDAFADRILDLTGPASLCPADQIAILAEVLDRPLVCRELTDDETRAELAASLPPEYAAAFADFYLDGSLDESRVYPTVREVTGHEPRTFTDWAVAHTAAFATD